MTEETDYKHWKIEYKRNEKNISIKDVPITRAIGKLILYIVAGYLGLTSSTYGPSIIKLISKL